MHGCERRERGGAKSGKKKRKMTDLTEEEEVPVSGGGSSSSAPSAPEFCRDLLLDNWKSKELWIAKEKVRFYERPVGLQDSYVKLLGWSDARQIKKIEVLEKENEVLKKKYQDVLDLNMKEYVEAHQLVDEHMGICALYMPRALPGLMAFVLRQNHGEPPGANKPHQAAAQVRGPINLSIFSDL
jgi:hypothetical protein